MDTDDFSEMAYDLIVQALLVSDTLKVEIGAMSRNYNIVITSGCSEEQLPAIWPEFAKVIPRKDEE